MSDLPPIWPPQGEINVPEGPPTKEEVESIRRFEGRGYIDACPVWAMIHIERLLLYIKNREKDVSVLRELVNEAANDFGHESDCYVEGYGCSSGTCSNFESRAYKALSEIEG